MWKRYLAELQVEGPFAAAIPKMPKEIESMLSHRMPTKEPENATPIDELAAQVAAEVGAEEEPQPGWATFKRDNEGFYYEGRCVRGHIKDCATQVSVFYPAIKAFKAKVANKVYVETDKIYLGVSEPAGTEQRFIQVMTRQGPRSTYKFIDYVESPRLAFVLKVLDDGVITEEHLRAIFEYGAVHGIGQERSQSWGRYSIARFEQIQ